MVPGNSRFGNLCVRQLGDTKASVRSALFNQRTGRLVVRWVTTSGYLLLYVFFYFCERHIHRYRLLTVVAAMFLQRALY